MSDNNGSLTFESSGTSPTELTLTALIQDVADSALGNAEISWTAIYVDGSIDVTWTQTLDASGNTVDDTSLQNFQITVQAMPDGEAIYLKQGVQASVVKITNNSIEAFGAFLFMFMAVPTEVANVAMDVGIGSNACKVTFQMGNPV
jgi:hypothetical protein